MIRVLIVDDHSLMRVGMRTMLDREHDIEVVGEANDGREALSLAGELKPDVITLDLDLPDQHGVELIPVLIDCSAGAKILVYTANDDVNSFRRVLQAGGHGYVVKMADIRDLTGAVRSVHAGRAFWNFTFNDDLARMFGNAAEVAEHSTLPSSSELSDREQEVLRYLALGHSNKQIAKSLFLSVKTIETYRSRLMKKLGLKDRADLMQFALRSGIVDREQSS